jgi:deoxyribodipyrimidine photolyase-like uncharacterized protein
MVYALMKNTINRKYYYFCLPCDLMQTNLKKNKFKLDYIKIEDKEFKDDYLKKLKKIINSKKIKEISSFEIEDKFFEKKISQFLKKEKINWNVVQTPYVFKFKKRI